MEELEGPDDEEPRPPLGAREMARVEHVLAGVERVVHRSRNDLAVRPLHVLENVPVQSPNLDEGVREEEGCVYAVHAVGDDPVGVVPAVSQGGESWAKTGAVFGLRLNFSSALLIALMTVSFTFEMSSDMSASNLAPRRGMRSTKPSSSESWRVLEGLRRRKSTCPRQHRSSG